jgi:septal ring factor EnvC (AmiA/AmiB activator)
MKPQPPPVRPPDTTPMPPRNPYDDAEHEIRRGIGRHYAQLTQIAELQTDLQAWQLRCKMAECEIDRLQKENARLEARVAVLNNAVATVRGQYAAGIQIWAAGFDALNAVNVPHLPELNLPQLTQETHDADHGRNGDDP